MKELTKDMISDKIFELEMELTELQVLTKLTYPDGYDYADDLQQTIQEDMCWLEYYKQLLNEMEQGEK